MLLGLYEILSTYILKITFESAHPCTHVHVRTKFYEGWGQHKFKRREIQNEYLVYDVLSTYTS